MNLILTSGPNFTVEKNGVIKAVKLSNKDFVGYLKKNIVNTNNLLFICSNPDDYKKNEEYANAIERSLYLSGIKFEHTDLLDSRNWLFTKSLVKNSDLIILLGGDPVEQIEFFNNIELKAKIKGTKAYIMGISAGSINMANYVYCSKDKNIEKTLHYRGLGLTNINIEPHFNINDKKRMNDVLIPDSKQTTFIALANESFITINNKDVKLYGDAYLFSEGNYKKIKSIDEINK